MKFAVRFSLSLTLVVLLAMVEAEPKPKTYLVETGEDGGTGGGTSNGDGGKEESMVSLVPPPVYLESLEYLAPSLESLEYHIPEPLEHHAKEPLVLSEPLEHQLFGDLVSLIKLRMRFYKCGSDADHIHIGFEGVERGRGVKRGRGREGSMWNFTSESACFSR